MMSILTCSTGTHHIRNNLKLFEISTFFVKLNTKLKLRRFLWMKHKFKLKNDMVLYRQHWGVLYIQKAIEHALERFLSTYLSNAVGQWA